MTYGYLRVSTDKQTVDNQRFEIERFCIKNDIRVEQWIEETISGTKLPEKRLLGSLLAGVKKDDLIICSELSRLGRSLFMIMSILNHLMNTGVRVWTIKDNYRLGDNIQSKVLAFAFGLSAEIERDLISQRIKEALARKKSEGAILGRPLGKKSSHVKLSGHEKEIQVLLEKHISKSAIGRIFGVNRMTVDAFIRERMCLINKLGNNKNIPKKNNSIKT
jgi:DNA invertase Pin-like site-specific DNA recombinase